MIEKNDVFSIDVIHRYNIALEMCDCIFFIVTYILSPSKIDCKRAVEHTPIIFEIDSILFLAQRLEFLIRRVTALLQSYQ